MSIQSQIRFLEKLDKELAKSSEAYRLETANKLTHTFKMTYNALRRACSDAYIRVANDSGTTISKKEADNWVHDNLETDILECITKTKRNIINYKPQSRSKIRVGKIREINNGFEVDFIAIEKDGTLDIFDVIAERYKNSLPKLYAAFETALIQSLGTKRYKKTKKSKQDPEKFSDITQGFVFNLEHDNKSKIKTSNIDLFIAQKFSEARRGRSGETAEALLTELGMKKELYYNKPSKVTVYLGSGVANRAESSEEKNRLKDIREKLEKALKKLAKGISILPGSDSLIDAKQKEVTKKLEKAFKSSKNLKVSFKDNMKLDNGSGRAATINIKPRVRVIAGAYKTPKPRVRVMAVIGSKARVRGPASMPLYLIGLINRDLNRTVANNMESPALNYRTGRFASSVRVTDVVTTPKGFPSIGYSYMKNPYQTFEPGFAQGSVERDPRKLIDLSIREIAAQYAIGRFYTRRV